MFRQIRHALIVFILLIPCIPAFAQTAQFSGRVTDPQQAVVRGAEVRVVNQATGVERKATTNADGLYAVPFVQPGTYQIFVQAQGFSTATSNELTVTIGQALVFDVQLKVGNEAQEVTVNATDQQINTTDASVSTVIDRQFVDNLPLNGRSFQSLLYMTPGVTPNPTTYVPGSGHSDGQFIVNGQRGDANYWMVDGVSANVGVGTNVPGSAGVGALGATNTLGGTSAMVSVDALQEFRIETSTYNPEFGRAPGGQISIQTRSGTNQFHGAVFDYLRNTDLDASNWFNGYTNNPPLPKAAEIQNDFGGVLGGPIIPNKTFFFFSYEGSRLLLPQTLFATVPDAASRENAIPAMQPFLKVFPLPAAGAVDTSPGSGYVPYSATFSDPFSADTYSLRLDHNLSKTVALFARYSYAPSKGTQRGDGQAANNGTTYSLNTKTLTVGANWIASAQLVNNARFNYSQSGGNGYEFVDDFGGGTPLPYQDVMPSPFTLANGNLNFAPLFGTNMTEGAGPAGSNALHQVNVVDSLELQKRSHSIKLGIDYRRLALAHVIPDYQLWPFFDTMENTEAGLSFFTLTQNNVGGTFVLNDLALYAQDTWRVNSRLNLTYGLRWDLNFVPDATKGPSLPALTGFSINNLSNLALAPAGTNAYNTHYGDVAPRVGGAYQLLTTPNWGLVVRGGFGVFYGLADTAIADTNIADGYYPFGATAVFFSYSMPGGGTEPFVPFPTPPSLAALPPVEAPNTQNGYTLWGFDPHLNTPYALEWNVSLEQALGKGQAFSLSYVGSADRRLLSEANITNPNPNYAAASLVANTAASSYNAMQLQFQRRLTNGLQSLISYTWAHAIDNGSYGNYANGAFADVNANRGDADFDTRNNFTAGVTYDSPAWKQNVVTRAITGGWSTSNIVQLRTSSPVDIEAADFTALSAQNASLIVRPDIVPGQPFYLHGSQFPGGKAINPAAFQNPPTDPTTGLPTRQGDLNRNVLRSLGSAEWDFAMHRDLAILESLKLQFRAEMFNVLNHPNFGAFNNSWQPDNGNIFFGQATKTLNEQYGGAGSGVQDPLYAPGAPRSIQLALKLIF